MKTWIKKTCNFCLLIFLIGIAAALFSLTPYASYFEEEYGLAWLFKMRGATSPPKEVIIVSLDKQSAEILQLPDDPEKWPRSYYAQLIKKLNQHNPAVIAINIIFNESRDRAMDQMLADEMDKGKNVILSNYLKRNSTPNVSAEGVFSFEHIINPIAILEQAAISSAPFPLPKTAATVKQFWTTTNSEGGVQTFPISAFQLYLFKQAHSEIISILSQIDLFSTINFQQSLQEIELIRMLVQIKQVMATDNQLVNKLQQLVNEAAFSTHKKQILISWVTLLNSPGSLYFNHYGTAKTITTVPLYQVLNSHILNPGLFNNKIILVGYSEDIEPEKNQGIYTVFSRSYGQTTSPIEIAATAVANLIDNSWLRALSIKGQFLLILVWGGLLGLAYRFLSYKVSVITMIMLSLVYLAITYVSFSALHVWLPLFIPLAIQTPLVLLISSTAYFFKMKKDRQNVQKAFSHYLPDHVINKIAYQNDINALNNYGEVMYGLCLATDAEQYTTLSETMQPQALSELMNRYYGVMFPPVRKFKGFISDVIGDAMLAIWAKPEDDRQIRSDACHAALEIKQAVDKFNNSQPYRLPTRMGLHFGEIRLGNVGADDHFEYRAVGDTVNSATRIEGLNKHLNTHILVSEKVIKGLTDFIVREIGLFILKGKKKPIHIYELIGRKGQNSTINPELVIEFTKALKYFQNYQWEEALEQWTKIQKDYPEDGATFFYINYLEHNTAPISIQDQCNQPAIVNIGNITVPLES